MPEGPEVTIITNGINTLLKNKIIISFEINEKSRYFKKAPVGYNEFIKNNNIKINDNESRLNIKVKAIKNKGKFIYWIFEDGTILFQTLGMSGGWYKHNVNNSSNHSGIVISYINNKIVNKLYFNDQRRFGTFKFYEPRDAQKELEKKLKTLGPDMLNDKSFSEDDFLKLLRKPNLKNKNITRVITNQKIISGVGNYLKAESLYHARINPHQTINDLTDVQIKTLYKSIKYKIIGSYNMGGTSIRTYSNINNINGKYKFEFEVYGKRKDKFNNNIIAEKIAKDTQNTYWCPEIQKI